MKTTGQRIKRMRERNGWSQLQLAALLNINNSVLSRIETGKRPIDGELLKRLADVFDTSCDYLLGRSERVREEHSSYRIESRSPEDEFFEQLRTAAFYDGEKEMSDEDKQIIMEYLMDAASTAKKIISRSARG